MADIKKGKFIAVDGIDGCGKGELVKRLGNYLFGASKKHHILLTREPYISKYHDEIRRLLKETKSPGKNKERLTELYVSDRKVHARWIEKEIKAGHIVISDRYKYSTLAYQWAQGVPLKNLIEMHKGVLAPDLTLIVDVPVDVAIKRADTDRRRKFKEVFERDEFVPFQEKLRKNYLALQKLLPGENIIIIDGLGTREEVFEEAKSFIDKIFE